MVGRVCLFTYCYCRNGFGILGGLLIVKANPEAIVCGQVDQVRGRQFNDVPAFTGCLAGPFDHIIVQQCAIGLNGDDKHTADGCRLDQSHTEGDNPTALKQGEFVGGEVGSDGNDSAEEGFSPTCCGQVIGGVVTQKHLVWSKVNST